MKNGFSTSQWQKKKKEDDKGGEDNDRKQKHEKNGQRKTQRNNSNPTIERTNGRGERRTNASFGYAISIEVLYANKPFLQNRNRYGLRIIPVRKRTISN